MREREGGRERERERERESFLERTHIDVVDEADQLLVHRRPHHACVCVCVCVRERERERERERKRERDREREREKRERETETESFLFTGAPTPPAHTCATQRGGHGMLVRAREGWSEKERETEQREETHKPYVFRRNRKVGQFCAHGTKLAHLAHKGRSGKVRVAGQYDRDAQKN
jgi:hypothetical protein